MKKLILILGCFILFTCTTEVEVENPINSENVKRISELETLLANLNSTLSQSENQNQNLLKEVNDLKEQLNQALSSIDSSEKTIDSLNIKIEELGLAVALSMGVQDGVYIYESEKQYRINKNTNDTLGTYDTEKFKRYYTDRYVVIEDGKIKRISQDLKIDIDEDPDLEFLSNWRSPALMALDLELNYRESLFVTGIGKIESFIQKHSFSSYNGILSKDIDVNTYTKWKLVENLTEETAPPKTTPEINEWILENVNVGILADSIYKNLNPYDPESLKEGFILDAERNGLDISYLRNESLIIYNADFNYGAAYGHPCESSIRIGLEDGHKDVIYPKNLRPGTTALFIMYHEMGHSALNLMHSDFDSDIMVGEGSAREASYLDTILDPLTKFRESTRRMFQNIEQKQADCGFATQRGEKDLIIID